MLNLLGCGIVCSLLTTLCWLWRLNKKTAIIETLATELREAGNEINRLQQKIDEKVAFSKELLNIQRAVRLRNYRKKGTDHTDYLTISIFPDGVGYDWGFTKFPIVAKGFSNLDLGTLKKLVDEEVKVCKEFNDSLTSFLEASEQKSTTNP
jgi:hypothetical protein